MIRLPRLFSLGIAVLASLSAGAAGAATIVSDGSDGAWNGGGTLTLDSDGVFNFTTIDVPLGQTLRFARNAGNTPVVLAATGTITIAGTIDVSAGNFNGVAGPGGGDGGAAGNGPQAGADGAGPAPGAGGGFPASLKPGNAGGGGAMATDGLVASQFTNTEPGAGGAAIGFPGPVGGSGGGGGSGWIFFGVELGGGVGGGGGGGLLITTPGEIVLNGSILANGGHAGWAFANIGGFGGPGGGGSGGNVMLEADGTITLGTSASVQARGGAGGGLSTQTVPNDPFFFSSGAHGGQGYLVLSAAQIDLDPGATIDATLVPLPPSALLFAVPLLALRSRRRH